jgi:hypothetical protein
MYISQFDRVLNSLDSGSCVEGSQLRVGWSVEDIKTIPGIEDGIQTERKWATRLGSDPIVALLESDEPFTLYRTLTDLLGLPADHPVLEEIRAQVLSDTRVRGLVKGLPSDWSTYLVKGHDKFDYPPSVLLLLFDLGVTPRDYPQIEVLLGQMRSLHDSDGRFLSLARFPGKPPEIGSSLCDTHIITEALLLGGYESSPEVIKALKYTTQHLKETSQGLAWKCEPNSVTRARGPGRKDDICPQVTVEALRLFSYLPEASRPAGLIPAGRTLLGCWSNGHSERPYMFGHGTRFKKIRPPFFWYSIGEVLDATSRHPELVHEEAFQEMLSAVLEKADEDGKFTPESVYRDFKGWSFGQKDEWSPWTTLFLCRILKRVYG